MDKLTAEVSALTIAVRELSGRVDTQQQLIDAIKKQAREIHATRMFLGATAFSVCIAIALAVGFGFLSHQVETQQHQLQQVQARTSTEILCPLYEFFALSLRVNAPPPTATDEQIQLRKTAADTIARGLTTLGCQP